MAVLFDPLSGRFGPGLRTPTALYSSSYRKPDKTKAYLTYQTIQGLAGRLGLRVQSPVQEARNLHWPRRSSGQRRRGRADLLATSTHPGPRSDIPILDATAIAAKWPGERFDVVWTFTLDAVNGRYAFESVPQQLLQDDTDTVI